MELETVRVGGTSIITVTGDLDADNGYPLFLAAVAEAQNGASSIVLDLAGVTFIDSVGMGMLIRIKDELAADLQAATVLRKPSPRVMKLLDAVALTPHFTIER